MNADPMQSGEPASVDASVLTTLREVLDDDVLLLEIIETFLDQTPDQLAALTLAAGAGENDTVATTAHVVKGSALTLGAVRLGQICAELERAPSEELAAAAVQEYDEVARHLSEFAPALR